MLTFWGSLASMTFVTVTRTAFYGGTSVSHDASQLSTSSKGVKVLTYRLYKPCLEAVDPDGVLDQL